MTTYPVAIHKDENSDYGVIVPDIPGCFSAGSTLEEAAAMAREAIEIHLEGMIMDGEDIPTPSPAEEAMATVSDATVWMMVEVDMSRLSGKAKRINLTVPEFALRRIDEAARAQGKSRSAFVTQAALDAVPSHG
ncbi:MAG: type II toxin-antitoxin system HicB family antitoxin [Magnetococcales bacterium]|nr:type II toxin-antitoxin system HicB family antitoxin [Magnetococcales bacterium]